MEMPEKMAAWQRKALIHAQKASTFVVGLLGREYSPRGLALLFLLALFAGASIKSLLNDSLTIGFDDYKLSRTETKVDLNTLEKDLIKQGGSLATTAETPPRGKSCFEEEE